MVTDTHAESADDAEIGDQLPKKKCDWKADYGGRPCTNDAVKANFARVSHRVNDHGVHISTKVRVVWVCDEHAGHYESVPDLEADVKARPSRWGESDD
ncbi:hypothetical protein [Haloarchaeobius sp. DYHT-AS-18]|uniref:hypothetical protein n=1 Tax=Haloarchaeobius sp. DYHT-AS-18 TaxID=3446117 RepID=UPI003EBB8C36